MVTYYISREVSIEAAITARLGPEPLHTSSLEALRTDKPTDASPVSEPDHQLCPQGARATRQIAETHDNEEESRQEHDEPGIEKTTAEPPMQEGEPQPIVVEDPAWLALVQSLRRRWLKRRNRR